MMEIRPFKAYRFNAKKVGDVGSCISPPYDVISGEQREELYSKNPYNIVRVIKGKEKEGDGSDENHYTRAADYLQSWIEDEVLKQDTEENLYAYVQDFEIGGMCFQRRGFVGLAKLEEFGKLVQPHENTLEPPKEDRLKLTKATEAMFGLVLMLYEDQKRVADNIIEDIVKDEPLIDFVDELGVRHRLFAISAQEEIDRIRGMMQDKSCIIADGHHRYETALNYRKVSDNPAANYQMAAFVNTCHEGLIVLATHRLVKEIEGFEIEKLTAVLEEEFEVTRFEFDSDHAKADARRKMLEAMKVEFEGNRTAFGIYAGNEAFYAAALKDKEVMDGIVPEKSAAWRRLDVSILHKLILEGKLGIDEEKLASANYVKYVKDTDMAIDESITAVDSGEFQAAFFMNPVKVQEIREVAGAGEKMPQKSTFFFPKVFSGLTINKL
ncbi:MAG: DUF1015 domain-containing protein [Planctomycetota bacterium]|jgi:uncharacterized protein (DUF1015 family)